MSAQPEQQPDEPRYDWAPVKGVAPEAWGQWDCLNDNPRMLVRRDRMSDGFLWQCQNRVGYQPTLEEARAMVEGLHDNSVVPINTRCFTSLLVRL